MGVTVASAGPFAPHSRQIITPAPHHAIAHLYNVVHWRHFKWWEINEAQTVTKHSLSHVVKVNGIYRIQETDNAKQFLVTEQQLPIVYPFKRWFYANTRSYLNYFICYNFSARLHRITWEFPKFSRFRQFPEYFRFFQVSGHSFL